MSKLLINIIVLVYVLIAIIFLNIVEKDIYNCNDRNSFDYWQTSVTTVILTVITVFLLPSCYSVKFNFFKFAFFCLFLTTLVFEIFHFLFLFNINFNVLGCSKEVIAFNIFITIPLLIVILFSAIGIVAVVCFVIGFILNQTYKYICCYDTSRLYKNVFICIGLIWVMLTIFVLSFFRTSLNVKIFISLEVVFIFISIVISFDCNRFCMVFLYFGIAFGIASILCEYFENKITPIGIFGVIPSIVLLVNILKLVGYKIKGKEVVSIVEISEPPGVYASGGINYGITPISEVV